MICRICSSELPPPFLDLGVQTMANALCNGSADHTDPAFPLRLLRCGECGLVQLDTVVDPAVLFSKYWYTPDQSSSFRAHFDGLAEDLTARFRYEIGKAIWVDGLVVDIGSNSGLFLKYLKARNWRVLGVDPAENLAQQATADGIPTIAKFWSEETAREILAQHGPASIITACNVFAHTPDLAGFVKGVKIALAPGGAFVIEAPSLPVMLRDGLWDTNYHEHYSMLSTRPVERLVRQHGLRLESVENIPIHGGSLRYTIRHVDSAGPSLAVWERIRREVSECRVEACAEFAANAAASRDSLQRLVRDLKAGGNLIAGYGAPAKATVLINYCGFTSGDIAWICDDSLLKQGRFLPGSHIPVVHPDRLVTDKPDAVIVFPWNVFRDILPKLPKGISAITPLPKLTVTQT